LLYLSEVDIDIKIMGIDNLRNTSLCTEVILQVSSAPKDSNCTDFLD